MNSLRLTCVCLALGAGGLAQADPATLPAPANAAHSETAAKAATANASLMPPPIQAVSPVAQFRRLLSMSPAERENFLTNRPPEIRAALRAKIQEYQAMDPDDRELRLRATELRWQLIPLLHLAPADRAARLAMVPEDLAPLVKSRLADWDQLPAAMQAEFLANDHTLHYFAHVATAQPAAQDDAAEAQRARITGQFDKFFELTPEEKQKTLKTLSATERTQMEQTLQAFGKLTGQQRFECLRAFTKFAGLSQAERTEFLKNAERWSQMSPQERQGWRDLVARVPTWPPLPPHFANLIPPKPVAKSHVSMATN